MPYNANRKVVKNMSDLGNKEVFARNLNRYIESTGKSQKMVADDLGFSKSVINEWCKGRKYPRINRIEMLADYFGILKSDLIEDKFQDSREEAIQKAIFDAKVVNDTELMEALHVYYQLTDKQRKAIINSILSYKG